MSNESGKPFQAPLPPDSFVGRREVIDKVRRMLEESAADNVLAISAVHGLGGIGKTALAAALAHDTAVRRHLPDGVLWVTLGQQPDILALLTAWIRDLGDYDFLPTTIESAYHHLRTLLKDQAILLVLDDAWQAEHARPFLVGGPLSQTLITTRRTDVAEEVGARIYDLNVMTENEALELLAARLGRSIAPEEQPAARAVAEAVGRLPLALALAAALAARGIPWVKILSDLTANLGTLESARLRRTGQTRLQATLQLSLTALRTDDEEAYRSFLWLGILPEDAIVPTPAAAMLWAMSPMNATNILELLRSNALLQEAPPVELSGRAWPAYRLHDLLHDLASRLLATPESEGGLGLTQVAAHRSLLERYRAQTHNKLWHTLPDDGYIHTYLAWHLVQAKRYEEVHALLAEETTEGRNGWYEARERLGQTVEYRNDVWQAWRLAETDLSKQMLYVLLQTSLNSLARNVPPALLAALVKQEIWTSAQGLAHTRSVPNPRQRAQCLAGLTTALSQEHLPEALWIAQRIDSSFDRVSALVGVADHLTGAERLLAIQEAYEAAQRLTWEQARAHALATLVRFLENDRSQAIQQALAAVGKITWEEARGQALSFLAPNLTGTYLQEALAMARNIDWADARAEALISLIPQSKKPERMRIVQEVLDASTHIEDTSTRVCMIAGLVPHLEGPERDRQVCSALEVAQGIEWDCARIHALAALAPHLNVSQRFQILREALVATQDIDWEKARAHGLVSLSPNLPMDLLLNALRIAEEIVDDYARTYALTSLVPYLEGTAQMRAMQAAVASAQRIEDADLCAQVLNDLAPYLPASLLPEALAATRRIGDAGFRTLVLKSLSSHHRGTRNWPFIPEYPLATPIEWSEEISAAIDNLCAVWLEKVTLDEQAARQAWQDILPILAASTRQGLLVSLQALTPILPSLGGEPFMQATSQAIRDVGRWWP